MSFDWTTFALQLVNVLVLLVILRHFLFRPVAAIIERRRAETQAALDAANAARAAADVAQADARAEAEASAAARDDVLRKAAAEAEAKRAALLDQARAESARIVEEGRAARARETAAAEERTMAQVRDLAAAIATRALGAQPAGPDGYVARLAEALERMDAAARAALLGGGNLALVAARPLAAPDLDRARKVLARYGATAALATDPRLIAGLELRSDSGVLRNSLAHDLDLLVRAMHDVRPAA